MRGRRILRRAALLLPAVLAACTLLPKREPVSWTTFLLDPFVSRKEIRQEEGRPAVPAPVTILVSLPTARPGFDTSGMAYSTRRREVRYYAYHRWADTPARMLAPLAVEALERAGCCRAVVAEPDVAAGDIRLDLEDLTLLQEFFYSPSRVRLSFRAVLVDLRTQGVLGTRRFEAIEAAPSEDAYGEAVAADRAAARTLRGLSDWVPGVVETHRGS